MSFGKLIDAAIIERGLIELNPDIHLDAATKHGEWHPHQNLRQGVFWHGQHICSMDRGLVPEFKVWSVVNRLTEVGWDEADKEDVTIQTRSVPSTDPDYLCYALKIMANENGYSYRPDGTIIKYTPVAYRKLQGRVIQVGWRHTFEKIINRNLPGLDRMAIAAKFSVDMMRYPIGAPHELHAALLEE